MDAAPQHQSDTVNSSAVCRQRRVCRAAKHLFLPRLRASAPRIGGCLGCGVAITAKSIPDSNSFRPGMAHRYSWVTGKLRRNTTNRGVLGASGSNYNSRNRLYYFYYIYIQNLQPRDRRSLFYIDDSIITVTLNSAKSNCKKLERIALKPISKAKEAIISFNISKIELIYFYSSMLTIKVYKVCFTNIKTNNSFFSSRH